MITTNGIFLCAGITIILTHEKNTTVKISLCKLFIIFYFTCRMIFPYNLNNVLIMDVSQLIKLNYDRLGIAYDGKPRLLTGEEKDFRVACLKEELQEFIDADNLEDQYDALLDLAVFTLGTIVQQGLPFNPGFLEVMRANYQKQVGQNFNKERGSWSADLVKPDGWKAPDLKNIIDLANTLVDNDYDVFAPTNAFIDRSPKVLVLGHGRHGKDTFANMLFESLEPTSYMAAKLIMFKWYERFFPEKYSTVTECYEDRHNHRETWHEQIKAFNRSFGWNAFALEVLQKQDCYVGMRADQEYQACKTTNTFDIVFWVDRFEHEDAEPVTSMTIDFEPDTMVFIDNNQDLANLKMQADYYRIMLDSVFTKRKN